MMEICTEQANLTLTPVDLNIESANLPLFVFGGNFKAKKC